MATNIKTAADFVMLICNIAGWMFVFLIAISIMSVVLAGYYYVLGGSDSENVSKAHRMLIYTATAIFVAVIARAIPIIVSGIAGVHLPAGTGC